MATNISLLSQLMPWGFKEGIRDTVYRRIYLYPSACEWLTKNIDTIETLDSFNDGYHPRTQLIVLFNEFMTGKELIFYKQIHTMKPDSDGIWELKTVDLRFFGWFVTDEIFVVAFVDSAHECKNRGRKYYNCYQRKCLKQAEETGFVIFKGDINGLF